MLYIYRHSPLWKTEVHSITRPENRLVLKKFIIIVIICFHDNRSRDRLIFMMGIPIQTWDPFYKHGLTLIPQWIVNTCPVKCGMKLLIHCTDGTVEVNKLWYFLSIFDGGVNSLLKFNFSEYKHISYLQGQYFVLWWPGEDHIFGWKKYHTCKDVHFS